MARQSKHAPAKVLSTLRQREAAELRAQKLTLDEIAEQLGISKPRVHQLLKAWDENFKSDNTERAEQMRTDQLEEIRLLKRVWFPRVIQVADSKKKTEAASAKDLAVYLKLLSHEADLTGAKAATLVKTELTGSMSTVQTTFNGDEYTTEELEQLQALLSRQQSPPAE